MAYGRVQSGVVWWALVESLDGTTCQVRDCRRRASRRIDQKHRYRAPPVPVASPAGQRLAPRQHTDAPVRPRAEVAAELRPVAGGNLFSHPRDAGVGASATLGASCQRLTVDSDEESVVRITTLNVPRNLYNLLNHWRLLVEHWLYWLYYIPKVV